MKRTLIGCSLALGVLIVGLISVNIDRRVHGRPATTTSTVVPPITNVATVSGPVRDVPAAAPEDRKLVQALTTKQTVEASVTTAVHHATGEGEATVEVIPPASGEVTAAGPISERLTFKDFRLEFTAEGSKVHYTLDQQFVVVQTIDRSKDGTRSAKAEVFEVTPEGRMPLQQVTTNVVERDDTEARWMTGFNIQGGLKADASGSTAGLVGLQWLKHGRTNNPADLKYAALTPAVTFGVGPPDVGLLPVSVNVANYVRHQPLTNVWVSPYVGLTGLTKTSLGNPSGIGSAIGVAVTATF
jgi:hypothetical protein